MSILDGYKELLTCRDRIRGILKILIPEVNKWLLRDGITVPSRVEVLTFSELKQAWPFTLQKANHKLKDVALAFIRWQVPLEAANSPHSS